MTPHTQILSLAERLDAASTNACRVVSGFDGFVDEMITLVGERRALDDYTPVPDISAFGQLVSAAAGQSSLREIIVTAMHPGGCAVNLSDGLASLGVQVECFATLGDPVHAAFSEVAAKCHGFHSWGREPGRTLAFEFTDGKLMFSAVRQLADFTPAEVQRHLGTGAYQSACSSAHVIALTDWTLYPHMTEVWRLLQREVFAHLSHRPHFFIDLVDPSSRASADLLEMTKALPGFEAAGPLTLGLNGNEAAILCRLLHLPHNPSDPTPDETMEQARVLRDRLGVTRVVIHRRAFAAGAESREVCVQQGPYCPNPRKSTGAGDRFNAGLSLGLALGWSMQDSIALGCGSSGYFVRHAQSASKSELAGFLRDWAANSALDLTAPQTEQTA